MMLTLLLLPFAVLTSSVTVSPADWPPINKKNAVDLPPIFRQDGFEIPGYKGVCSLIPNECAKKSTTCMTATCNKARGDVCWGQGKAINSYCEDWMHDIDDNLVAVPGVCVDGVCVHVPDEVHCPEGELVAFRTFPSCGDVGFGNTFRFVAKKGKKAESIVKIGVTEQTFGPDLAHVKVTTSQTINDGNKGIATISYLSKQFGDCVVGHQDDCKIKEAGTYNLMGMTIKWDPDSGNALSRESTLYIENQVIEFIPKFFCSNSDCRTTIKMEGTSPTPCGDTQLTCQHPCKYSVSGFQTHPELNGNYVERVGSGINGFSAYTMLGKEIHAAKALKANEWWFDDDLSDYESPRQTAKVKAFLPYSATQNPFDSEGIFQAFEKTGANSQVSRMINIRQKCRGEPGPCGPIEGLYSTQKFWSVAYGTVRFTPPDYNDASVKERPNDPYNIALLGDIHTADQVEFTVEVNFRGQMAGILVFGSQNSYVMCRLDSTKKPQPTGVSIVKHANTMVVNGREENGQLANPENTPIRLKITIHGRMVTCYTNGLEETSEEIPRISGTYTGTHTGKVGFVTLNAAASFRILGCPKFGGPIIPPVPPCPRTTTTTTRSPPSGGSNSASNSDSIDSVSTDSTSADDSDDGDISGGSDSNEGGSNVQNGNFFGFNFGGDSDDAEFQVGDDDDDDDDDSSSDDPDKGPSCVPGRRKPDDSSDDDDDDGGDDDDDDSLDVEAMMGVQTESLSHAVFVDRIFHLLASVGFAASLFISYRLLCSKVEYEVVAEPEQEEI